MFTFLQSCFLVLLVGTYSLSFSQDKSQSVIATAGDISKISNMTLEWTLGELAVETGGGDNKIYTQGFHQPVLITKLKPSNGALAGYTIKVFPNPVSSIVNITVQAVIDRKIYISLVDVRGRVLYSNTSYTSGSSLKIDMRAFTSGIYFLVVTGPLGAPISTYKIVKAS